MGATAPVSLSSFLLQFFRWSTTISTIELHKFFHIKMLLWLAYDHWTGLNPPPRKLFAADGRQASVPTPPAGQASVPRQVDAIKRKTESPLRGLPELVHQAPPAVLVFVRPRDRLYLPAFVKSRPGDHPPLVIGSGKRALNVQTIVTQQGGPVVCSVMASPFTYINFSNVGGAMTVPASAPWVSAALAPAPLIAFLHIGLTPSPPPAVMQEFRSAICRFASWSRC